MDRGFSCYFTVQYGTTVSELLLQLTYPRVLKPSDLIYGNTSPKHLTLDLFLSLSCVLHKEEDNCGLSSSAPPLFWSRPFDHPNPCVYLFCLFFIIVILPTRSALMGWVHGSFRSAAFTFPFLPFSFFFLFPSSSLFSTCPESSHQPENHLRSIFHSILHVKRLANCYFQGGIRDFFRVR